MQQCDSISGDIQSAALSGMLPSLGGSIAEDAGHLSPSWTGGRRRLLWVDDSGLLLSLYKSVFERLGFDVVTTSCPAEALKHLSLGQADLAILDYDMPAMDGGTLASMMKDRSPMFPVILYSGNTSIPSSARHWVDAICAKGSPREELLDTIERLALKAAAAQGMGSQSDLSPSSNH